MKQLIIAVCVLLYALCTFAHPTPATTIKPKLLGSKECTWGPSYWCSNITNAKGCNAVSHCIQTVWEHLKVPEDNDDVCQICVKMVKQARDQLESNETQEELKEVFEGSCALIPLKIIAKECDKLVDDFVPELVETLASQMNPQTVCTVAGLCNNVRIDKLLAEQQGKKPVEKTTAIVKKQDECQGCHTVVGKLQSKFSTMTKDQVLQGILNICGRMSSLSDACTNIVITYFPEIYSHLQDNLNPDEVCLLAGVCTAQFHSHSNANTNQHQIENVEITPLSDMGRVDIVAKDELPCELCEQLVKHLRDLLVANTTEMEFQRVLEGLCTQTKGFKDECMSLVDQYYPEIYQFLLHELNSKVVCVMMGVCQKTDDVIDATPEFAMLPPETVRKSVQIMSDHSRLVGQDEKNSYKRKGGNVEIIQDGAEVKVSHPELVQLPIERMNPVSLTLNGNTQLCTFCEYFLHFIQEEITKPKTEEKIKKIVSGACAKLPRAITEQCVEFVDMYGDAFVALLVQELDPSQICPLLSLCPSAGVQEVEILMHSKPEDKPNCPLCLFAVTQLEDMIKNHKTKESIKDALDKLCSHLPKNLAGECEDFVETYSNELIEMLVADLSPQEVCVYLKLCDDKSPKHNGTGVRAMANPQLIHRPESMDINGGDWTINNEIPDNTIEGRITGTTHLTKDRSPQCVICEFVMSQIERELKDKTNEEEVKHIVHGVCNHLPKSVSKECNDFVDKYADAIIKLLVFAMEPSQVCESMAMCSNNIIRINEEILDCAICETTVTALDKLLNNPKIDHAMEHVLKKACLALSTQHQQKCKAMIDTYGDSFFHLVTKLSDARAVCNKVGLCSGELMRRQRQTLLGEKKCTWGPSYWCSSTTTADECNARDHCMEKYWKGTPPQA